MNSRRVHDLIERIGNLVRTEGRARAAPERLQPVHLQVLDYLASCNRYSDSPGGVTEYLGITKGTVSQTLLVLEGKGLISRKADPRDRRRVRLSLTAKGRRLVGRAISSGAVTMALARSGVDATRLASDLEQLLRSIQQVRDGRSFGVCHSCSHFTRLPDASYRCGLTEEPLSAAESELICREHEFEQRTG